MGSSKRRKPVRHLPKVSKRDVNPILPSNLRKAIDHGQPISFRTYLVMIALLVVIVGGIVVAMALH